MPRVCFVSDLHLFARRSTAAAQYDTLVDAARTCDTLVLGGDIFDFRWSTQPTPDATAAAGIDWLGQLLDDVPEATVHYLLGNHDHTQPLIDRLPGFAATQPRFDWHGYYLRIGQTMFLHGDVADRPMSPGQFVRRRQRSLHHGRRRRGRFSNAAYQAALRVGVPQAVPHVVHPTGVTARRILRYLDAVDQRAGIAAVYFGHTHRRVSGFTCRGVRFWNPGAPIGGAALVPLLADVSEGVLAAS